DTDHLFVVACNKCFKEFTTEDEPDGAAFVKIAEEEGKSVTGSIRVDFLCNKTQTARTLQDMIPEGTESIFVVSCGLGVQTIADLAREKQIPVFAAADSLNYTGYHGMALTEKKCGACAQCYLNVTGGLCPIVDCSKSLINGQCGGAKNGKCEVDPEKDCAWEKIYRRLEKQGRLEEFLGQPVQLRDYSKVDFEYVNNYVTSLRQSRLDGYYGGVHPLEGKEATEHLPLQSFPEPETVAIPLSMHAGAPANPIVEVGDTVKVGQKIGESAGFISSPVHSSVSGTVIAIETRGHATRGTCPAVVIRSDGKNTLDESVQPRGTLDELTSDEIVEIVKEAGIVGMGGAGFPTSVKLKPAKPVDTILLNGCECEPLLTADHRLMLEYADDVIFGLRAILKTVGAEKGVIVIEDNKPDAIELMKAKAAGYDNLEVQAVKTKYPQGAEKMLIKHILKRQVPSGGLPADVGCVVSNVSTAKAISDAIQTGMPLIERAVTVTGERLKKPGNYMVKIGTNTKDLVDFCGGVDTESELKYKAGGPMMGFVLSDLNVPIMKGSNGLIAVDTDHTAEQPCIKCGRCMDVCPMELAPLYFARYADTENWQGMKDRHVMDCVECRCCEYICSSKIPLVSKIKAGKTAVRGMK
ncbi:MAG: electron transport complex subunit RsxC, partial [Lachnospiraceae bacterium]|nr:electron transport complex subunit RsxC [Lachnospiraceae bacterium]